MDKNKFSGLPLTLFSVALLYVFSLLGGIIEDIINSNIIVFADVRVANLLVIFRNAELTQFFLWITLLGKWQIILIFTTGALFILWLQKKRHYIVPLLLSIVGSEAFTYFGKIIFHRARPDIAIYTEHSFSFPSGHATMAVAFYGFLAYILIKNAKQWKRKVNIFFAVVILILLIGFSRLYLGVHYFSDVWGGYLVGSIWLIVAISLAEYFSYKKITHSVQIQKKRLATIIITIASVGLYIIFALSYQIPALVATKEPSKITIDNILTIFNTNQLKYTETLLGSKQEPISFIILAKNEGQFIDLFKEAGWYLADDINISSVIKTAGAALWKDSYPTAPMTPDFWDTNVNDFGFEKATSANNIRARHHARFWKTNYVTKNRYNIYVGTASFDSSIKWGVTHKISPDIDTEREFLFSNLEKTKNIIDIAKIQFVNSKLGKNFSGDLFFTDGRLYLLQIK